MKILFGLCLVTLAGCGMYVGTEGVIYIDGALADGGQTLVPPEVIMGGIAGLLGPLAPFAAIIPGASALIASFFITKRKKGS